MTRLIHCLLLVVVCCFVIGSFAHDHCQDEVLQLKKEVEFLRNQLYKANVPVRQKLAVRY